MLIDSEEIIQKLDRNRLLDFCKVGAKFDVLLLCENLVIYECKLSQVEKLIGGEDQECQTL